MTRLFDILRHLSAGWRLLICLCIGSGIFLWPFEPDDPMVHAGAAWLAGVLLFLGWTAYAVHCISIAQLRKRARELDDNAWVVSLLVVIAALISLLGLGLIIYGKGGATGLVLGLRLGFGGASLIASWFLIHTVLALHYAHLYYGDAEGDGKKADRKGLEFPGKGDPDYSDFFYYSFVIGMTCQVSDISIQSRGMRRLTLVHSIVSFFFNTTVIALTVNLIASN
ncbi:DUF1345 domain-containing protein [Ferrovibrio terrae]|uniref:DUF1345 domain-containing protein n=1 Tax=Ferrovibrio terrae TaxID=2594003 RepID=A0A516H5G2_9PROT|nr:DUF1345 domain-containing protein [Ferrovibrio terrae]QDO99044.1 DUF1345 domain-containing protein [Ferrovibrio terrae]